MPINALRKKGARMSLQEALERVEKLKRLAQSSNPHEAALAELRLKSFDVNAARAPRRETHSDDNSVLGDHPLPDIPVEVLDEVPEIPYREIGGLEARQPSHKKSVNWDVLHFELIEKAREIGADALINIQLSGTVEQKILAGTALKYLNPKEIIELQESTKLEDDEKAYSEAQKERLDENLAPGID